MAPASRQSPARRYEAVLFDLLTALLDSQSLWNEVAGSEAAGASWRKESSRLAYSAGAYRPFVGRSVES